MPPAVHLRPADLRGLGRLAIEGVTGVTDLVEAVHAAIARVPFGAGTTERTGGITRLVYGSITTVTRWVGGGVDQVLAPWAGVHANRASSPQRDSLLAVLNGVLGDHLEQTRNPLAVPMSLRLSGRPAGSPAAGKLMILVHGLCMNDRQWSTERVEQLARRTGHDVARLHYNTGRSISLNGRDFATHIEALVRTRPDLGEITLVGHSMGGLVARSAIHAGHVAGHAWTRRVTHLVCLGSPHQGAPLERGGHGIDQLLSLSPYSRPFGRLGRVRSAGITDLRHGQIEDSPPDSAAFRILLLAGQCADAPGADWMGDGLIPVYSALDSPDTGRPSPSLAGGSRIVIPGCGHLDLVSDARVFDHIHHWYTGT